MLFVRYDSTEPQITSSIQKLITLFCFCETFCVTGVTLFCNSR